MMDEETIELPVGDLEAIHATLSSVHNLLTVQDLVEQYRKLNQRPTPSKLTTHVRVARDRVAEILLEAHDEATEAEEGDGNEAV